MLQRRSLRCQAHQRGPTATRRAAKARTTRAQERAVKALVRARDQYCRWPECVCVSLTTHGRLAHWRALEVAHLVNKGIGGDPRGIRTQTHLMILLCRWRHQGPFGIHAGRAKVTPLTDRGTDGPCEFTYQRTPNGAWLSAGETSPPDIEGGT